MAYIFITNKITKKTEAIASKAIFKPTK